VDTAVACPQCGKEAAVASARPLADVKVNVGAAKAAAAATWARGGGNRGVNAASDLDSPKRHRQISPLSEPEATGWPMLDQGHTNLGMLNYLIKS